MDKKRQPIGIKNRTAVHEDGDWHETFQCWFAKMINGEPFVYLQRRSQFKKDFPSMYDITAAGHLLAGETVREGVREIAEELGVNVDFSELKFLGAIPNSIILPGFIDREISLVYLYIVESELDFSFEDKEVEGIVLVKLKDLEELLVSNELDSAPILNVCGDFSNESGWISKSSIVPHERTYFQEVFNFIRNNL